MATRAEGWAALRDGLGPAWLLVAAAGVAGFWTVHEPGAAWTTMLSGRPAGFVAVTALATLWAADWVVRYALEADAVWLRASLCYAWAVLLVLSVPLAVLRLRLEPADAVAVAAGHLWLAALAAVAAALLWFHAADPRDAGRRFFQAVAVTAAALAVWSVQAGVLGWAGEAESLWVAWPVALLLLVGFVGAARLAGAAGGARAQADGRADPSDGRGPAREGVGVASRADPLAGGTARGGTATAAATARAEGGPDDADASGRPEPAPAQENR